MFARRLRRFMTSVSMMRNKMVRGLTNRMKLHGVCLSVKRRVSRHEHVTGMCRCRPNARVAR
jgi:hypothetical protein